jgi:uncharacterized protein YcbK (DUF882 family)
MNRRRFLVAAAAFALPAPALAGTGPERRLALLHADSGERFSGPIDGGAIDELAWFLRDRREGRAASIDPDLPLFLADVAAAIGAREATVRSGYRTPTTNKLLIKRGYPAAEGSLHLQGEAIDVSFQKRLPEAANAARKMKRGGVGWYPSMRFVHLDVGAVRSWTFDGNGAGGGSGGGRLPTVQERLDRHRALAREDMRRRGS